MFLKIFFFAEKVLMTLSAGARHRAGASALATRDRSFSYNLVATTLRRLGQIDDLIDRCLNRRFQIRRGRPHNITVGSCPAIIHERLGLCSCGYQR